MDTFHFKEFKIQQHFASMKVGTDGVLLGAWVNAETSAFKILDIGTGTGLIALMMAQKYPDAIIDAIDIEEGAVKQTNINASNSPWKSRIKVYHASLENFMQNNSDLYDIIICNPPYFINGWNIEDENRKKARDAVFLPPKHLMESAKYHLANTGSMNLILPAASYDNFFKLIQKENLFCRRRAFVKTKENKTPKRVLLEIVKVETIVKETEIIIENAALNSYTDAYKTLTRDFYLHF